MSKGAATPSAPPFPIIPGDAVCNSFREAVDRECLSRVEVGAALATLLAGFIGLGPNDDEIDAIMDLITGTVKVQLAEHRKMLEAMPAESKRRSPFS